MKPKHDDQILLGEGLFEKYTDKVGEYIIMGNEKWYLGGKGGLLEDELYWDWFDKLLVGLAVGVSVFGMVLLLIEWWG